MNLSPHFSIAELTVTTTGIPNTPTLEHLVNLKRLAETLEQVRYALGRRPVIVSSAFRNEAVNNANNGSKTSEHKNGNAADFTCPTYGSPKQVCLCILDAEIEFDQLILEYRGDHTWVHIGLRDHNRGQVMTIRDGKITQGITL